MSNHLLSTNHFLVQWGGTRVGCSEVSGLDIEVQVVDFRDGSSPEYQARKMPVSFKYPNIILRRTITPGDNEYFDWLNTTQLNRVERRDLSISLLNEDHEPVVTWHVRNAFPVKLSGPVLRADGNEVAIESIEIAHEGLTVVND